MYPALTARPVGGTSPIGVWKTPLWVPEKVPSSTAASSVKTTSWMSTCASGNASIHPAKNSTARARPSKLIPPGAVRTWSSDISSPKVLQIMGVEGLDRLVEGLAYGHRHVVPLVRVLWPGAPAPGRWACPRLGLRAHERCELRRPPARRR